MPVGLPFSEPVLSLVRGCVLTGGKIHIPKARIAALRRELAHAAGNRRQRAVLELILFAVRMQRLAAGAGVETAVAQVAALAYEIAGDAEVVVEQLEKTGVDRAKALTLIGLGPRAPARRKANPR